MSHFRLLWNSTFDLKVHISSLKSLLFVQLSSGSLASDHGKGWPMELAWPIGENILFSKMSCLHLNLIKINVFWILFHTTNVLPGSTVIMWQCFHSIREDNDIGSCLKLPEVLHSLTNTAQCWLIKCGSNLSKWNVRHFSKIFMCVCMCASYSWPILLCWICQEYKVC